MASFFLKHVEFVTSGYDEKTLPAAAAEVAFAGRSNAGKSSAINALTRRKGLARVSKTPGRTQAINFFRIGPPDDTSARFLVDLPGYGFAKVPEALRRKWVGLLENYLRKRSSIRGLMLIMDARHPFTELDCQMLDWYQPDAARPVHILLTKADKLGRQAQAQVLQEVREALAGRPGCSAQLFSSSAAIGREEAEQVLAGWLAAPPSGGAA